MNRSLVEKGRSEPLWYVGSLQSENGKDIEVEVLGEGDAVPGAPSKPPVTRPSGRHPGQALRAAREAGPSRQPR